MSAKPDGSGILILLLAALFVQAAQAETFSNFWGASADLPAGTVSFADELIEFSPGVIPDPGGGPDIPLPEYRDGTNTLGAPDMDLQQFIDCSNTPSTENCRYVALGDGGSLTVKFTDNFLTGSDDDQADLYIFETGPPNPTFVDISSDGLNWFSLGLLTSFAFGIDIDAFGFGSSDLFSYVRLTDEPLTGQTSGITIGADIDSIGAISTTLVPVPLPLSGWLFASAISVLLWMRRVPSGTVRPFNTDR